MDDFNSEKYSTFDCLHFPLMFKTCLFLYFNLLFRRLSQKIIDLRLMYMLS